MSGLGAIRRATLGFFFIPLVLSFLTGIAGAGSGCVTSERHPVGPGMSRSGLDLIDGPSPRFRLAALVDEEVPVRDRRIDRWLSDGSVAVAPVRAAKPDRYGALPAFLVKGAGAPSLQEELLRAGLARLDHGGLPEPCFAYLRTIESKAISEKRGLWTDPRFSVLAAWNPEAMAPRLNGYQIVEGRILSTGRTSRRLYLNFGEYWAEDFTVEIGRRGEAALRKAGMRPEDWVGARIRVRGWLSESRGPMMMVESPNQIERLSD